MHHVYILWSSAGCRYYIGITDDVERRLRQHNTGESKWTKRYIGTWQLVWQETCESLTEARKLENTLKKQKGGNGFYLRTGLNRKLHQPGS